MPSLVKMLLTWRATVFSLMNRSGGDGAVRLAGGEQAEDLELARPSGRPAAGVSAVPTSASSRARSGERPAQRRRARAASSSISARVLIAELTAGEPDQNAGASSLVGCIERAARSRTHAAEPRVPTAASPSASRTRALGIGPAMARSSGAPDAVRDRRPARPRPARAASISPDAIAISTYGVEQAPAGSLDRCASSRARRSRGGRATRSALAEPEQGEAGFRSPASLSGLAVRILGLRELAAQPVELGLPIEGLADRRVARLGQLLEGSLGLLDGVLPGAVELHELGPVEHALAAIRDQIGLRLAPSGECRCPLLGPPQIEDLAGTSR